MAVQRGRWSPRLSSSIRVRGTSVSCVAAVLDVTDERAGFDAAPVGMLEAEPEQVRLIRVNDALCSILQRSREELLGSANQ